jgi:hypothetical protein
VRERTKFEIREARSKRDRDDLYKFRYRVFVQRANRLPPDADNSHQRIEDKLDDDGINFIALRQSEIVGALRVNYASRSDLGMHEEFFRMREAAGTDHPGRTCIVTRLATDPVHNSSKLAHKLTFAWYRHALSSNARVAFLSCDDDLIFDFSVLGFKAYMGRAWQAEYGQVLPMKLDLLDERYMAMTRSPLLPVLRGWKQSRQPTVQILPL